jgi:hypothetical protein
MGTKAEKAMIRTKQFKTPAMAEQYLGHSTEPSDVDWEPLREPVLGRETVETTRRAHPRRKHIPYGPRDTQDPVRKVTKLQIRRVLSVMA